MLLCYAINPYCAPYDSLAERAEQYLRRIALGDDEDGSTMVYLVWVVLKAAKKNGLPCLCLEFCGGSIEVHHALPVKVMRVAEMQYHLLPRIQSQDVQLELQLDRPIRTVVEQLKIMSPYIKIEGRMTGELSLSIDGDGVFSSSLLHLSCTAFWRVQESKEHSKEGEDAASTRCMNDQSWSYF